MTMPSSTATAKSSKLTVEENNAIEKQVEADTVGLPISDVEKKVSTAYTQYKAAIKKDGKNSRPATAALFEWALLGRHLDSMQGDQHVSSIALVAGF